MKTKGRLQQMHNNNKYDEGTFARRLNKPITDNPYTPGTAESNAWISGWEHQNINTNNKS